MVWSAVQWIPASLILVWANSCFPTTIKALYNHISLYNILNQYIAPLKPLTNKLYHPRTCFVLLLSCFCACWKQCHLWCCPQVWPACTESKYICSNQRENIGIRSCQIGSISSVWGVCLRHFLFWWTISVCVNAANIFFSLFACLILIVLI